LTPSSITPLIFPAVVAANGAPSTAAQTFPRSASEAAAIPETCSNLRRSIRFMANILRASCQTNSNRTR
jgi:hypothetical protein